MRPCVVRWSRCAHGGRPNDCAAKRDNDLSPSDGDCLPRGSCPCNEETIARFWEGTNNALRCESIGPPMSQLGQTRSFNKIN
jgi:hypothetical protein